MKLYFAYADDGSSGVSGQVVSITNPRSRLYIIEGNSYEECTDQLKQFTNSLLNLRQARKNPRITETWLDAPNHPFLEQEVISLSRQQADLPSGGEVKP